MLVARKPRTGYEVVCELVFRPLAQLLVPPLARLRVPPPAVVLANAACALAAAVVLAQGHLVLAAVLLQVKTLLDNADGQLARTTGQITALGRYLDSLSDLMTNAAVVPAWMNWPGSTNFCTMVPASGARITSSGRIAPFCCSASAISAWSTPKIFSVCSAA